MKNNFSQEIVVSLILIILLGFFINPFAFTMSMPIFMMIVLGLVVAFAVFASFVWKENGRDEREDLHKMLAGRFAFLVGMAVLLFGVIFQSFKHNLDIWLVLTLGLMILAKIIGLIYTRVKY